MERAKKMVNRQYHLFDAQGKVLGRLAVDIARALSGRGKVDFTPNIDGGDCVVVVNTDGIVVTGAKRDDKIYHHYSGYPGGIRSVAFKEQVKKDSREIIRAAVWGMLPKNKLRDRMIERLMLSRNGEHAVKTIHITHA